MSFKPIVVSVCIAILSIPQLFAQRHEAGLQLGTANMYCDLGGSPHKGTVFLIDLEPSLFREAIGIYYRNQFASRFLFKTSLNYCMLRGDDAKTNADFGQDGWFREQRGLSVKTTLAEWTAEIEYAFMFFRPGSRWNRFSPYVGLGAGAFYFNPKGPYGNGWVNLRPLSTEGQGFEQYPERKKYWIVQPLIAASVGAKYNFTRRFSLGTSLNVRKTFTDYLDDVSREYVDPEIYSTRFNPEKAALAAYMSNPTHKYTSGDPRGNPKLKDSYFMILVQLQYHFGRNSFSCPRRM